MSSSSSRSSNPRSKPKPKLRMKVPLEELKYQLEETPNPQSQSSKNKSKLPQESQFAALKIDDDDHVNKKQDPYDWRLGFKKDGDDLRPRDFDFPVKYVTELSTKCEKKKLSEVVRKIGDDRCTVCKMSVTKCRHYVYNAKWGTYTVIFCGICGVKGQHWSEQCPQKGQLKPVWKIAFSGVDKIPWMA